MLTSNVSETCYNLAQWLEIQKGFWNTAMQFGYFCLLVGILGGIYIGWHLAKRKYGMQ